MRSPRLPLRRASMALITWMFACGGEPQATEVTPTGPIVSVLDLGVSLRASDAALSDAHEVEISSAAIQVDGAQVLALTDGLVPAAERPGEQLPKLAAALGKSSKSSLNLAVASSVSYETALLVLSTAEAAGVKRVAFKVRPPGGGSTTGFLAIDQFSVRPKAGSDAEVAVPGAAARPWSDFAAKWEEVQSACGASPTGNCAYKPQKIAEGGQLKVALYAAGQGVNIGFFRVGAPPPEAAPAEPAEGAKGKKAKAAKKKKKAKPELIDGVKAPPIDPLKELEEAPPATEALFQFRAQEAVTKPSALSSTLQPLCGGRACGVVVHGEKATLFIRVLAMLGAAFPDGSTAPSVVFERP